MIGISDRDFALIRYENFSAEVLAPTCVLARTQLDASVFQTDARNAYAAARAARYSKVALGWHWGPAWSTAWFRLSGVASDEMQKQLVAAPGRRTLALGFSSGTEAVLWTDGVPARGFDENRELVRLQGAPDAMREFWIEAACNMPLGISTFWWDHEEAHKRWREETPGRFERAELVVLDEERLAVRRAYDFAIATAKALPETSPRVFELIDALREVTSLWERDGVADLVSGRRKSPPSTNQRERAFEAGDTLAAEAFASPDPALPATYCHAAGHAHIDTAWLWPMAETRRKTIRSFANALELIERHPTFRFSATQPQQYAWIAEDSPELFGRITAAVEAGAWEPSGAMWVEPDCNAPSAESLVRQLLYAEAFRRAHFPGADRPRFLFLPDTFGFPAGLPQILAAARIDLFLTDKLAWNESTEYPHTTFRWRGLDGTEILTHLTPGTNYNAPLLPADLLRGAGRLIAKDASAVGPRSPFVRTWLQPYGFGDGGGGPTEETFLRAGFADDEASLPAVEPSTIADFAAALHAEVEDVETETLRLPVWDGELYIEQHRGTFTSQSRLKGLVARLERRFARLEALWATRLLLAHGATEIPAAQSEAFETSEAPLRARLAAAWKTLLLHQFHDILPGSSIAIVHEEARLALEDLERELQRLELLATGAKRGDETQRVPHPLHEALPAPALANRAAPGLVEADHDGDIARLSNEHLVAELHPDGRLLLWTQGQRDGMSADLDEGAATWDACFQLELFVDRPRRWDAWNLDGEHLETGVALGTRRGAMPELHYVRGAHVAELRLKAGASPVTLRASLEPGDPFVTLEVDVDWQAERRLLRAKVQTQLRNQRWTTGTQLGFLDRPTHANTAFEEARFEIPGQRWMDVSMPGRGVAVLDEFQLGRSARVEPGGAVTMGLSLLRAPAFPDAKSDRGKHHLRLAVMLHDGDWRAACVPACAAAFAERPLVNRPVKLPAGPAGEALARGPFGWTSSPPGAVELLALKPAEDGRDLILRVAERHGSRALLTLDWRARIARVVDVDLYEKERATQGPLEHEPVHTQIALQPFELRTLRVTPEAESSRHEAVT